MIAPLVASILTMATVQTAPSDWSAFPGDGAAAIGSEHVHDPTVIQVGNAWVCFSTSGDGFAVLRTSKDLKSWKVWGPVLPETPAWLLKRIGHKSLWAPDIAKVGTTLRMYYSASERFGGNGSVIGFAENASFDPDDPLKGWVDKGQVIESVIGKDTFNAIDPEVHIAPDGRHWMYFGSYFAGLYVVELDPATGFLKNPASPAPVLVARNTGDRGNPLEAAAVCRRGEWTYLFVSYGLAAQGVRSTYRIMVGRSKSPTGPFQDAKGVPMADGGAVNVLKGSPPMFAPGHSDVLQDSSGRWLMPYHFYDGREYWGTQWGLPTLQIRELLWSADGWPLPGLPLEMRFGPSGGTSKSPVGEWLHQADFGRVDTLEIRPDGTFLSYAAQPRGPRPGPTKGKWELAGDLLNLHWVLSDGSVAQDGVQLAYGGKYYVGRNQNGIVIRGIRK